MSVYVRIGSFAVLFRGEIRGENIYEVEEEPKTVRQGETLAWTKSLSDYPASVWTLKYSLRSVKSTSTNKIDLTATASGDDYAISVLSTATTAWLPGIYWWYAWVEKGSGGSIEKHPIDSGQLEVLQDLSICQESYDGRSHAKKVLDAIEAVIEGRATLDQQSITLEGNQLIRTPVADLLRLRDFYRKEVQLEEQADRIAKGLDIKKRIGIRFLRV